MKTLTLTINVFAIVVVFFFLFSNHANAEINTFNDGDYVEVEFNFVEIANTGHLNIFDITNELYNFNFNYNASTNGLSVVEFCSNTCTNGNFGVSIIGNDSFNIDVSQIPNGEYIFALHDNTNPADWSIVYSNILNNNVGQPFQATKAFIYVKIAGGAVAEYSFVQGGNYSVETREIPREFQLFLAETVKLPVRLFLISPKDQIASFTSPLSASVIQGVQNTGQNIWPLFVFAGIPLAFIIALQLIVFTKRATYTRSVEFDNKKADELEIFYSKTGKTNKDELNTIRKIDSKR